ncbi:uncharacterized protein LOC112455155 [Temnothorax curvispinosus]|uniref:Uncharacterized protein LOC112455155 n=1 Tax=Temnothorax curvispinosus TaxID=300111 RepID=A0A6J1PTW1_9HYME|nr:uncharacterized protein LOC112455155 [Temnothorax curvispinosus]
MACVVRLIERLGLKVTPQKTQATLFYTRRGPLKRGPPQEGLSLRVRGIKIPITPHLKYLGMWLDGGRGFGEHVAPRAGQIANSLARLLPNIGGAGGHVRRLYVATVHLVLLYAAPIWWEKVGNTPRFNAKMAAAQKSIAIRAARVYRTVSHIRATTLAGIPPIHLLAKSYAKTYEAVSRILDAGCLDAPTLPPLLDHRRTTWDHPPTEQLLVPDGSQLPLTVPDPRLIAY